MNFLEIVEALHREAKLPGSPPSTVAGQSGRANDLVRWAANAYRDIQSDHDGKWKWLRRDFTLDTTASTASYAYGAVDDTDLADNITRFRRWDLDRRNPPFIFLVSDGQAAQRELGIAEWSYYRRTYLRGTHENAPPSCITEDPHGKLWLGPTPNDVYQVDGSYWRSNQVLAANDDTPEMPADFHMTIVWRALLYYAYDVVGQEVLAKARSFGVPLYQALEEHQLYSRFSLSLAGALA